MTLHPLVGFLLCYLMLSAEAAYVLQAHFHTYENKLHAYRSTTSVNGGLCCSAPDISPPNCTDPCATKLWYCFKKYGTITNFSVLNALEDCTGRSVRSEILENNTDFIDFSFPHSGNERWPGRIQFFVQVKAGDRPDHVVDYLHLDFSLSPGETLVNKTLTGQHFGSDVIFTVSFNLTCKTGFHGPNCSVYCQPENSDELGHYSCLSDGSIQCLDRYRNESTNCTECVPAEGCQHGSCDSPGGCRCAPGYEGDLCEEDLDVCGHTSPCQRWEVCTNTGPNGHRCSCMDGYEGTNCSILTEETGSSSVSAVPIAAGVSVGCLVLLIATVLVAMVVLMAPWRRRKSYNVDFEGEKHAEKSYNVFSGVQTPGSNPVYDGSMGEHIQLVQGTATTVRKHQPDKALHTLEPEPEVNYSTVVRPPQPKSGSALNEWHPGSNPVYDGDMGKHCPLGKSPTAAGSPERQLDNPLYTMGTRTAHQPPQHDYGYASSGSCLPATGPVAPPTSTATGLLRRTPLASPTLHKYDHMSLLPEEEQLYDAPNVAPRPRPQQSWLTYDYTETPSGTVGSPTAVYDAPLLSEEPATASHDYADKRNVNSSDSTTPPDVPGQ